jgi:hypothetical protein
MIRKVVDFALNNRFDRSGNRVVAARLGRDLIPQPAGGSLSRRGEQLRPGHHAMAGPRGREVEQQVTIPLEIAMNGIPHWITCARSRCSACPA